MIEIDLNEFPGVKKWVDRIEARDAVKKGVKVGASKSPEEMAEMFKGVSIYSVLPLSLAHCADVYKFGL